MNLTIRTLERARLARSAAQYATHGWDVVPGAAFTGERFRCDDPGCPTVGCHPATGFWQNTATHDRRTIAKWWRRAPYAILLPTGRAFDVLEVPAPLGLHATWLGLHAPVAVTAAGRWMILVRPGEGLRPELAGHIGVVRHSSGSWIPAPPTREPFGRARWRVPPDRVDWHLPGSREVQELLVAALLATSPAAALHAAVRARRTCRWPVNPRRAPLSSAGDPA
jgi:hypothetical protein